MMPARFERIGAPHMTQPTPRANFIGGSSAWCRRYHHAFVSHLFYFPFPCFNSHYKLNTQCNYWQGWKGGVNVRVTLVGGDGRRGMTAILGWYPTSVALYRILAGVGGSNTVNVVFLLFTLSPPSSRKHMLTTCITWPVPCWTAVYGCRHVLPRGLTRRGSTVCSMTEHIGKYMGREGEYQPCPLYPLSLLSLGHCLQNQSRCFWRGHTEIVISNKLSLMSILKTKNNDAFFFLFLSSVPMPWEIYLQ